MPKSESCLRFTVLALAAVCAGSAWVGSIGMISGLLPTGASLAGRLPFQSPVFGGVALGIAVGVPMSTAAVLSWRRSPRAREVSALAGLMLTAWILVEVLVVRQISVLQPVCAAAGVALLLTGDRAILRQLGETLSAVPLFVAAPLRRPRHLRWGATDSEVASPMPGDDLVCRSHFTATRAITVAAPPEAVWPWLVQAGFGRAGFYSYDLLDNLGRRSAAEIHPEWQRLNVGDLAAPMTNAPTADTSFSVAEMRPPVQMVWAKPDSTWSWTLTALPDGQTRLVTRLRQRYRRRPSALVTVILLEVGDFAMMRKMLLGIRRRAESITPADDLSRRTLRDGRTGPHQRAASWGTAEGRRMVLKRAARRIR